MREPDQARQCFLGNLIIFTPHQLEAREVYEKVQQTDVRDVEGTVRVASGKSIRWVKLSPRACSAALTL